MTVHYLSVGAAATDCGVKARRRSDHSQAMAETANGNWIQVTKFEDRVNCKSCRRAFVHRDVESPTLGEGERHG